MVKQSRVPWDFPVVKYNHVPCWDFPRGEIDSSTLVGFFPVVK